VALADYLVSDVSARGVWRTDESRKRYCCTVRSGYQFTAGACSNFRPSRTIRKKTSARFSSV